MSDGIVGAIAISLFGGEKKRRLGMDAGYPVLSSDLEACRMFDQYSYKRGPEVSPISQGGNPTPVRLRGDYETALRFASVGPPVVACLSNVRANSVTGLNPITILNRFFSPGVHATFVRKVFAGALTPNLSDADYLEKQRGAVVQQFSNNCSRFAPHLCTINVEFI
ncbi:hypothetical protein HN011_004035 [Eciton burchellii]|nr:hypothetical protein HN011_004035 [Eciton burchellii]